jgi:hypothetical protein
VIEKVVSPIINVDIVSIDALELFKRNIYFASSLAITPILIAFISYPLHVATWKKFLSYLLVVFGTQVLVIVVRLKYSFDYEPTSMENTIGYSALKVEETLFISAVFGAIILFLLRFRSSKPK